MIRRLSVFGFSVDGAFYDDGRGQLAEGFLFLEEEEGFECEVLVEIFRRHA